MSKFMRGNGIKTICVPPLNQNKICIHQAQCKENLNELHLENLKSLSLEIPIIEKEKVDIENYVRTSDKIFDKDILQLEKIYDCKEIEVITNPIVIKSSLRFGEFFKSSIKTNN